ncbi:hypothetical protein Snoj_43190 [Streptomyces nojiriensis]|uniref:Secreted protein n=1 Tax=Streptomyces nojiriensis TaxID=66374 RepID=A0ABQ3SQK2_9ACTN|nr:hypothetical protein GCM10010205_11850 [Streptomyces nojiriensis]GHI70401.1 hypothetical protein Snoj_43190 [Streptomyces nojiriensis]
MTAWSRSGGRSALSKVRRLVPAGLAALLLLGLFGVCCSSSSAHGDETDAVRVASVSSMDAGGPAAASGVGCSAGDDHAEVEGARRSGAPSRAAAEPDPADALCEVRTSSSGTGQSAGASSEGFRSQVVLRV